MTPLPIDPVLPEVIDSLRRTRSLVLVAPPGSGKTTRVPPAILRAGLLGAANPTLVLLQPRRVAARGAAARIAFENGWEVGGEVGYQIRFERRAGPRTRLRVETEGVLNRRLVADPFLEGVGAVVLDEFHERSLHTDLALAMLREVRDTVRDDLILVVMSATMDAGPVSEFLGGCPVVRTAGRAYPVEVVYRPTDRPGSAAAVAAAVEEALAGPGDPGDVLVFLPGAEEIRRAGSHLAGLAARAGLEVLPLHGSLPEAEQARALRPSAAGRRRVILATNIAETSLTIDGVRTVVDAGLARTAGYDPARGLDRLELGRISRASADQRAGRAGRTAPGRCVRLWSAGEQAGLAEHETPEVARVDLAGTVLALRAWGAADPARFGWFEPPPADRLEAADRLLGLLGAVRGPGRGLTDLGRRLLAVPAHPRVARLLVAAADAGRPAEGAALAALLSEKDIAWAGPAAVGGRRPDRARGSSDLLTRLDLLAEAERRRFAPDLRDSGIDPAAARQAARARDDYARVARRLAPGAPAPAPPGGFDDDVLREWVLLAYPDRVVRRRGSEATGVMVGGRGVRLDPASVVRDDEFFVALDPRDDRRVPGSTREARVRVASGIAVEWLDRFFPDGVRRERTVRFDDQRQRAVGVSSTYYLDLLVREDRNAAVDPGDASAALAGALAPEARAFLEADDAAAGWLARLALVRDAQPGAGWPDPDDEALADVLALACAGKRGVEEVKRVPFVPLLNGLLPYARRQALEELAPEALAVPSGSRVRLTYGPGRPPVLAVRLQELFGWRETPRIAGGRVAVVLHLLGPSYRPVQVTDDLASFWASAYFQVRKDLRARYPRHSWPDDPLAARPEARGGRRQKPPGG